MSEVPVTKDTHNRAGPLSQRIGLQQQFGARDLTAWFLELASPGPTDSVLDIGCGSGNHLLAFAKVCASCTGVDVSAELLQAAENAALALGLSNTRFIQGSGDDFDLKNETFDIVMCNFAIYYMDAAEVIRRMASHLDPDGAAYIMGSPDENAQELLWIHAQATDYLPDTYAPGYSDIRKLQGIMERFFGRCTFHRFVNPVSFPTAADFMAYYTSTGLFHSGRVVEPKLEAKIEAICQRIISADGAVTITKVVETAELRSPTKGE